MTTTPKTPTDFTTTDLTTTQQQAVEKLERSMTRSTLADFVKAKTRRTIILVDCSDSMNERIGREPGGPTKRDQLLVAVADIRAKKAVPVAAFGHNPRGLVELVDAIPLAAHSTPMHTAIDFAHAQGANHIVLVTDGCPDSEALTLDAARAFGKPIEVFYIGNGRDRGAEFARVLGAMNGGSSEMSDINKPKELAGKITLMLGDGSL